MPFRPPPSLPPMPLPASTTPADVDTILAEVAAAYDRIDLHLEALRISLAPVIADLSDDDLNDPHCDAEGRSLHRLHTEHVLPIWTSGIYEEEWRKRFDYLADGVVQLGSVHQAWASSAERAEALARTEGRVDEALEFFIGTLFEEERAKRPPLSSPTDSSVAPRAPANDEP